MNDSGDSPGDTLMIEAPAKINLSLLVTGRRDDGYHLLDSLIVFAGVHDGLTISPGRGLSLEIDGPFGTGLAAEGDNLVTRAATLLAEEGGVAPDAHIKLTKNLPVSSGIGGGSADAAAALLGLCRLWSLDISDDDLARLGLGLGADIPVCLFGKPARVRGIGEDISAVPPLPSLGLLLVNPGIAVSTPAVFSAREGAFSAGDPASLNILDSPAALCNWLRERPNDLEQAARSVCPAIDRVLDALTGLENALMARLSGSGATCFALFETAEQAQTGAEAVSASHPDWWVCPTFVRG